MNHDATTDEMPLKKGKSSCSLFQLIALGSRTKAKPTTPPTGGEERGGRFSASYGNSSIGNCGGGTSCGDRHCGGEDGGTSSTGNNSVCNVNTSTFSCGGLLVEAAKLAESNASKKCLQTQHLLWHLTNWLRFL